MVDINNRSEIFSILENLSESAKPVFGKLRPQHMLEHLWQTVMISNGKQQVTLCVTEEQAAQLKAILIYTGMDFPMEFKAPLMPDDLPELHLPDLKTALENLKTELEDFDTYFSNNEATKPVNPILGELNKKEWTIFHNKHFTHHFKQFNLL